MILRLLPLHHLSPFAVSAAVRVELSGDRSIPAVAFAAAEIERAAALAPVGSPLVVSLEIAPAAGSEPEAYRLKRPGADRVRIVGSGAPGAIETRRRKTRLGPGTPWGKR